MKQFRDTEYYVTEDGDVYSNKSGKLIKMKPQLVNKYFSIYLRGEYNKNFYVHRLVAECYLPNPNNLPEVNHDDGNKTNNNVSNLYWCTRSQNIKHAYDNGFKTPPIANGEKSVLSKLTNENVLWIRENYIPRHPEFGTRAFGKKFNMSHSQISKIIRNKRWKHI
jgi:hypothetical protein